MPYPQRIKTAEEAEFLLTKYTGTLKGNEIATDSWRGGDAYMVGIFL